jgi:hypothetical protein
MKVRDFILQREPVYRVVVIVPMKTTTGKKFNCRWYVSRGIGMTRSRNLAARFNGEQAEHVAHIQRELHEDEPGAKVEIVLVENLTGAVPAGGNMIG